MARTLRAGILAAACAVLGAVSLAAPASARTPFDGNGMWIWYVSASSGGDLDRIAKKARNHHIRTIYVKAADGRSAWSQFTPGLVDFFNARGIDVCAWQFVYGTYPGEEADRGAEAVEKGADCLVIDAEGTYEGRYASADRYVDRLHRQIGHRVPVALSSFPYVDYHPGFPYSVFLGPGAARYNLPQLYWHTIGVTVGEGYRHTYRYNRVYRHSIFPIGQTYENPPLEQIVRFRRLARSYEFGGVSWWSWQETNLAEWRRLGRRVDSGLAGFEKPTGAYPLLQAGDRGDLVLWVQQHIRGAGLHCPATGIFGERTLKAVLRFQRQHGLLDGGVVDKYTWRRLLDYRPDSIDWSSRSSGPLFKADESGPRSAKLPALRNEIPSAGAR